MKRANRVRVTTASDRKRGRRFIDCLTRKFLFAPARSEKGEETSFETGKKRKGGQRLKKRRGLWTDVQCLEGGGGHGVAGDWRAGKGLRTGV